MKQVSKIWVARCPKTPPEERTSSYECGTYQYFDVNQWTTVTKSFKLRYDEIAGETQPPPGARDVISEAQKNSMAMALKRRQESLERLRAMEQQQQQRYARLSHPPNPMSRGQQQQQQPPPPPAVRPPHYQQQYPSHHHQLQQHQSYMNMMSGGGMGRQTLY